MKCPVCRVPTYVVEYDGIEIDLCAECEGLWFDQGELDLLLDDGAPALTAAETDEAARPCPLCSRPMAKVNIGDASRVLIDHCSEGCGLWFDADELAAVAAAAGAGGWGLQPRVQDFLARILPQKGEAQ